MTDETRAPFRVPASFVVERVLPTAGELAYGYRHGWITAADVVEIALAKYNSGSTLVPAEEALALLLARDLDEVDELVPGLEEVGVEPSEERARLWLFLGLAWLFENRAEFDDPFGIIEDLYADFGYPDEIAPLARYMPVFADEPTGPKAMTAKWERYLEATGTRYRTRLS